jgi:hypothetical protein
MDPGKESGAPDQKDAAQNAQTIITRDDSIGTVKCDDFPDIMSWGELEIADLKKREDVIAGLL